MTNDQDKVPQDAAVAPPTPPATMPSKDPTPPAKDDPTPQQEDVGAMLQRVIDAIPEDDAHQGRRRARLMTQAALQFLGGA